MYYPDEIIEEVIGRNDIVDVVSGYVHLKRQGGNYFGLCPFHNEKSPSFSVSPAKQMYYCFGCGAGGSVLTFIRNYENYSFQEALQFLAERVGVTLPEADASQEAKSRESKRQQLLAVNAEAAKFFYYQLRSKPGEIGKNYFESRALSGETMKKFGLGYSLQYTDALVKYLKGKGYTDELIIESGLARFDEKYGMQDKFFNRVMFPIQDINHKVIGFGGRVLGDAKPKYLNSPETMIFDKSRNLYGLNFARTSRRGQIILCEGYMDVIAMHQAGFTQAAASLGTSFTAGQANILKRYTKDVYLAYDSDGAGVNAALRAVEILRDNGLNGKIIDMRPYKDPDEFMKNLGAEEFQKRIENAENSFLFQIRMLENSFDLKDPTGKTRFDEAIAEKLCLFEDEIERENYLSAVCEKYGISPPAMRKKVIKTASQGMGDKLKHQQLKSGIQKKNTPEDSILRQQRLLLTMLADDPRLYAQIEKYITAEDFVDETYRKVAEMIFEGIREQNLKTASIINKFEDLEEQQRVSALFYTRLEKVETREEQEKAFHDIVVAVKKNSFKHHSSNTGRDADALRKAIEGKKALEALQKMRFTVF